MGDFLSGSDIDQNRPSRFGSEINPDHKLLPHRSIPPNKSLSNPIRKILYPMGSTSPHGATSRDAAGGSMGSTCDSNKPPPVTSETPEASSSTLYAGLPDPGR